MATIKGQNLRLMIGVGAAAKCVAAATSATLHVAANVEGSSTKDTEEGWEENDVVALDWDVECEGLVTTGLFDEWTGEPDAEAVLSDPGQPAKNIWIRTEGMKVRPGMTAWVHFPGGPAAYVLQKSGDRYVSLMYEGATGSAVGWTNVGVADVVVYGGAEQAAGATMAMWLSDDARMGYDDLVVEMLAKRKVAVSLNSTGGRNNTERKQMLVSGTGIVEDVQVQAQNRQNSTFSVRIKGTGELSIGAS